MTIKKLFKKAIGAIVAGAMVVAMAVPAMADGGETTKKVLFEGSVAFDDGWNTADGSNGIKIETSKLGTLKAGDKIAVTATATTADSSKVTVQNGSWSDISAFGYPLVTAENPTCEFTLTDDIIANITANYGDGGATALVVKGGNVTVTKVELIQAVEASSEVILYEGSVEFDDGWNTADGSNGIKIETSKLGTLKAGD
ncbi:MAG: hypothetical protein ACI4EU_04845, partial [Butyrivibrio sp.]